MMLQIFIYESSQNFRSIHH